MHNDSIIFFNTPWKTNDFFFPLGKLCNTQGNLQNIQNPWENGKKDGLENILGLVTFAATEPSRSIWLRYECKTNGCDYWAPVA